MGIVVSTAMNGTMTGMSIVATETEFDSCPMPTIAKLQHGIAAACSGRAVSASVVSCPAAERGVLRHDRENTCEAFIDNPLRPSVIENDQFFG